MSAKYPLSIHRRIERQWAERIKSLKTLDDQIVVVTERALQHAFNDGSSLIPIAVRTVVDRRRLDQPVPHD
jgi:hypothetical protein